MGDVLQDNAHCFGRPRIIGLLDEEHSSGWNCPTGELMPGRQLLDLLDRAILRDRLVMKRPLTTTQLSSSPYRYSRSHHRARRQE